MVKDTTDDIFIKAHMESLDKKKYIKKMPT